MKKVLRIKQYLGERCMTQVEAAELCGLKQQAFSRIVNGIEPPYPKRGKRIADALGWQGEPSELFEEVEIEDVTDNQMQYAVTCNIIRDFCSDAISSGRLPTDAEIYGCIGSYAMNEGADQ